MLKLFNPADLKPVDQVSDSWSLPKFFTDWYVEASRKNTRRKPPEKSTIDRRRAAIQWWQQLMSNHIEPDGPPLSAITDETLATFLARLRSATYRRGKNGKLRSLSTVSQKRTLQEIQLILAAAGPPYRNKTRAAVLDDPPAIYVEAIETFPKSTWSFNQAKSIAAWIRKKVNPSRAWEASTKQYRDLAIATIEFWLYTGHRATTIERLTWGDLIEQDGKTWLHIVSVKTGKLDRVACHPVLKRSIERLRGLDPVRVIPWPMRYRTIAGHHSTRWIPEGLAAHSPQAWRRLHTDLIAATGFEQARQVAAASLGHASARTTENHYSAIRDQAILAMPDLY